jgi:hypothetical protein
MYAWIWRRLPFGLIGKMAGSLILTAVAVAVLWFWAFPAAEPLLPFGDVQVEDGTGGAPSAPVVDTTESVPADNVIPYSTVENQPSPRPSR